MITERSIYVGQEPYVLVCEPFLRKAPNGEMFILFQSGGHTEPASDNVLFITHSQDKGKNWAIPREIFSTPGKGTWSSEVYVDEDRITAFVYEVEQEHHFSTLKVFRSYSYDNGYTWTPREAFAGFHECCNIRQRVIRSDGAWLLPFCYTTRVEIDENVYLPERLRSNAVWKTFYRGNLYRSGVLISTDKGKTFERYHVPTDRSHQFLWEPNLVEVSDGRLVMLMRHEYNGWMWKSESSDGGKTWSMVEQTDIPDPAVKMRLLKLKDGRIILFCHPNQELATNSKWQEGSSKRHPLEMWISADDMKTWYKKVSLQHLSPPREGRPVSLYPYPEGYIDEEDRKIYIAVDLNRKELVMFEIPFADL